MKVVADVKRALDKVPDATPVVYRDDEGMPQPLVGYQTTARTPDGEPFEVFVFAEGEGKEQVQ